MSNSSKLNLAVCISGGGSTLMEVLNACKDGRLSRVNPALIITNNPEAGGVSKAADFGFAEKDIRLILRRGSTEDIFGEQILLECRERAVDVVAMCGFLPKMPKVVTDYYEGRIFNQHPGPIDYKRPGFGGKGMHGLAVHEAVLYFARHIARPFATCATVHHASDRVDEGALIGISPVAISPDDSAETLAARVLPLEHTLVVNTIWAYSEWGAVPSYLRREPLIQPGEQPILEAAKAAAVQKYPNG